MSKNLMRLADKVLNQPLLLTPAKAELVMAVLGGRIGLDVETPTSPEGERTPSASRFIGESRGVGDIYSYQEYFRLVDGVAVITVDAALVNKGAWVGAYSGLVSYEGLRAQIALAMADEDVNAILLDFESPGGEVFGCFELAEYIAYCAQLKPIHAVADGMACSAAYILASACNHITAIKSGSVGSIGVVLMHVDRSARNEMEGLKPTLIHAGAHKVDGHPHAPLSAEVKADWQREIDQIYDQFVEHVALHRGLSPEAVRGTEAKSFNGTEALRLGLIDMVGSLDDALAQLSQNRAVGLTAQHRGLSMTNKNGQAAASGEGQVTQAELDAATATAREDGRKEGMKAEQDRVTGILGLAGADEHGAQALAAIKAGMSVDQAKAMLESMQKPAAGGEAEEGELVNDGPAQYASARRQAESQQPDLGAGGSLGKPESGLSRLVSAQVKRMRT